MVKVYVIAEVGVNHDGSLEKAKEMIAVAAKAGANAVKFQTFKSESLVSINAQKAEYQQKNTGTSGSQLQMLKKLELSYASHVELLECCRAYDIEFLSSPFDLESIRFLDELGLDRFKIPSGEITNLPYLREIARCGKHVLISTGMSTMNEVRDATKVLSENGLRRDQIIVLHCNSEYPTPMQDVNLTAMKTIERELGFEVGYSDHTEGLEVSIAAVALGAKVIEKHFTLDRNSEGPDHRASIEPASLTLLINSIRNIENALGNGVKSPSPSESKNLLVARKSIVACVPIKKGEIFTEKNITTKRPANGLTPMVWDEIIGCTATRDYSQDDLIER